MNPYKGFHRTVPVRYPLLHRLLWDALVELAALYCRLFQMPLQR